MQSLINNKERWIVGLILLLSAGGFVNAFIVHANRIADSIPRCIVVEGCAQVLTSPYSQLFGVDLSVWGMIFYGIMFILAASVMAYRSKAAEMFLQAGAAVGFLFSLYLFYLQAAQIGSFCSSCLLSFTDSVVLFVLALTLWRIGKRR